MIHYNMVQSFRTIFPDLLICLPSFIQFVLVSKNVFQHHSQLVTVLMLSNCFLK